MIYKPPSYDRKKKKKGEMQAQIAKGYITIKPKVSN